jgi:hypothetical protein
MTSLNKQHDHLGDDANRDPISGAPGAHPVGVGVGGILGGAAAGAAAGTVLGPIGTLIGAAVGVVVGSAAGKGVAERIDPTVETEYWRGEYKNRPYVDASKDFDRDYATAYGFGLQAREVEPGRQWEEREAELEREWPSKRGSSTLEWSQAREAARDSWDRADRTFGAYSTSDEHFRSRFDSAPYRGPQDSYDDYAPAYRYGTRSRFSTDFGGRTWDDATENDLKLGWDQAKHHSRLSWDEAKGAVQDAFTSDEPFNGGRRG